MSTFDLVPMLRAPEGWPGTLVATVAMVALAGLDLLVAFAAREWVEHRSRPARYRVGLPPRN